MPGAKAGGLRREEFVIYDPDFAIPEYLIEFTTDAGFCIPKFPFNKSFPTQVLRRRPWKCRRALWGRRARDERHRGRTVCCARAVRKVGYFGPVFPDGQGDRGNYCVPMRRTAQILTQSNT